MICGKCAHLTMFFFSLFPSFSDYLVECACGQGRSSCLVARSNQTILNRKQGKVQHEEKHHSGRTFRQRSHSHVVVDEDSNSSWASTGSGRKRSRRVIQSPTKQPSRQVCDFVYYLDIVIAKTFYVSKRSVFCLG